MQLNGCQRTKRSSSFSWWSLGSLVKGEWGGGLILWLLWKALWDPRFIVSVKFFPPFPFPRVRRLNAVFVFFSPAPAAIIPCKVSERGGGEVCIANQVMRGPRTPKGPWSCKQQPPPLSRGAARHPQSLLLVPGSWNGDYGTVCRQAGGSNYNDRGGGGRRQIIFTQCRVNVNADGQVGI